MPRHVLQEVFLHNDWAMQRVLEACERLNSDALDRTFEMGMGTIRATLHHLWAAERVWLDRWRRSPQPRFADPEPRVPREELSERLRTLASERDAFIAGCGPEDLRQRIAFRNRAGEPFEMPLGDMVLHVANHGIHHRAQISNMIRQLSGAPGGLRLDYIFLRVEQPTTRAPTAETARQLQERGLQVAVRIDEPCQFDYDTIREYYHYSDWALDRVFAAAAALSDELLDQPFEMGLGTLRKTLLHLRDAEQNWVDNWIRGSTPGFARLAENTALPELRSLYDRTIAERENFLSTLDSAGLQREIQAQFAPGSFLYFRLGEVMLQLCGHGTHHRAQAINMIRRLGGTPPGLDYSLWCCRAEPSPR